MAENSKIEWCDHTFNPWVGCAKVSPACDNCYAEALDIRFGGDHWGPKAPRRRTAPANWRKPLKWNKDAQEKGIRYRVFCASMADVFDNKIPNEWREDLWDLIRATPHLDWLLLTKRPQNIKKMLPEDWDTGYLNVWLGTTVEDEKRRENIKHLEQIPCAIKFLSVEPLIECLNLRGYLACIHWVIVGGESGPVCRPLNPHWVRLLRDQCKHGGIAFFFKQWGGQNKKAAGRELDGRTWDEFPEREVA